MQCTSGPRPRALTIVGAVLCALGVAGSPAAQTTSDDQPKRRLFIDPDTGERAGPSLRADGSSVEPSADETPRVAFDLVSEGDRVTSYDHSAPSGVDVPFSQVIADDAPGDLRFVIFDSVALVSDLSPDAKQALLKGFEAGTTIIGAEGTGRDLKHALDLITLDLHAAGTTTGGEGLWVLLQRSRNGHLNELTIAAPQDADALQQAFRFAWNWYERNTVAAAPAGSDALSASVELTSSSSDDPWDAVHNFEWSGEVLATFEGTSNEHAGTYSFLLSVYFLDDAEDQDTDYYRLDFGTLVSISEYEMTGNDFGDTSGKCGWWIANQHAAATVTNGAFYPNGYMPDTTVGSTSTTFTVGVGIDTSGPSANASYSQSYGTPDVTINVYVSTTDNWLDWEATLVGCGSYKDYPDYSGASDVAKSTYNLNPSFIATVPAGSQLEVTTTADGGDDQWGFVVQKDKIDCQFACAPPPNVHSYFGTYTQPVSVTCDSTGCT